MLVYLEDDDKSQASSKNVPELQSELVRFRAPGRGPVIPVPGEDRWNRTSGQRGALSG